VSGAQLRGLKIFKHQGCNSGKLLATCGRFDRLRNLIPPAPEADVLPLVPVQV